MVLGKKDQNLFLDQNELLKETLDSTVDGVVVIDRDFNVLFVNKTVEKWTGKKKEKIIGKHCHTVAPQINCDKVCPPRKTFEDGQPHIMENKITTADGFEINQLVSSSPLKNDKGEIVGCVEVIKDITESKKADEALRESEEKFKNVFEHASIGRVIADPQGNFIIANQSYCKITGYTEKEVLSKNWKDLTLPEDMEKSQNFVKQLFEGKLPSFRLEEGLIRKDGTMVWIELNVVLVKDVNGKPKYMIGDVVDINERKEVEEALQASEEQLRLTTTQVPAVLWTTDTELVFTSSTGAGLKALGLKTNQVVGMTMSEYIQSNDPENAVLKAHRQALKGKITNYDFEWEGRVFDSHVKPLQNKEGSTIGTIGFALDVTERKEAGEALIESEAQFRTLAEKSPNMIFINKMGKVVFANEKCEEVMGYSREEFYSPEFDFISLIEAKDKGLIRDNFKRHMIGKEVEPYEYTLNTKNGEKIDVIQTSKLIQYGGDIALLGIITDISERKKAEQKLRESENYLNSVIENSGDAIITTDRDGILTLWSKGAKDLYGYRSEEVLGKNVDILYPPELKKERKEWQKALLSGKTVRNLRTRIIKSDGEIVNINLTLSPMLDKENMSKGTIGVSRDITEVVRAESNLKDKVEELEKWQRLTVGREGRMVELKNEIEELKERLKKHEKVL
jgi:PAS domain S-box-containing protein